MTWESRYIPPDPTLWQGRHDLPDDSCFYQHMQLLNLLEQEPVKSAEITFALVGFKCDEGVQRDLGRTGAFEGPTAIRQRLGRLPIQKPSIHCYDAGNIICTDHDLETSQAALAEVIARLLKKGIRPIVIGGGHEVAWGHFQGIARVISPQERLGIINFDAHFDMHPMHPSHRSSASTTFYQIARAHEAEQRHFDYNCIGIQHAGDIRQSFDFAKQFHVKHILADDLHQGLQEKCFDFIDRVIDENHAIYLSLSLDVFSPAFAPGVSSVQPLGLNPWHIIPMLRQAAASAKMISYDIAEHVPRYDIDHRTAKLAAVLIYEIIHHHIEPAAQRVKT
ncbi:Formimidoylglutamase [Aquicella siphonis]|uniref:Formimidoylglutamase n=1 Tax=Aquicella siphonis TaxID=254247 RepID=A0A5E4PHV7_9COXI|nr:formimidoylglutamase [Aquicella siphonis]VVC76599.1 Formimidoylglutamase [Aquicella siphonis]